MISFFAHNTNMSFLIHMYVTPNAFRHFVWYVNLRRFFWFSGGCVGFFILKDALHPHLVWHLTLGQVKISHLRVCSIIFGMIPLLFIPHKSLYHLLNETNIQRIELWLTGEYHILSGNDIICLIKIVFPNKVRPVLRIIHQARVFPVCYFSCVGIQHSKVRISLNL